MKIKVVVLIGIVTLTVIVAVAVFAYQVHASRDILNDAFFRKKKDIN